MHLEPKAVPQMDLLLDPNNYRFHDLPDWSAVQHNRFHDPRVQARAAELLRKIPSFEVGVLRDSIRANGFVPLEQIVVRPYAHDPAKYIVVEGNRRIAAIRWLLEEDAGGINTLTDDQRGRLATVTVLCLDPSLPENGDATEVLMAIRHVSGIKAWGAYQQARLIVELMSLPGAKLTRVGERMGMSARDVARRYRASMAVKQMESNPEFQSYVTPDMHGLFQETFASTEVRKWLDWDDERREYVNADNLTDFYTWISNTGEQPRKIMSVLDIRTKLSSIVRHPPALQALRESGVTLEEAYEIARGQSHSSGSAGVFEASIRQAAKALSNLTVSGMRALNQDQVEALKELQVRIADVLQLYSSLQGE
jgi:hypothetical protein